MNLYAKLLERKDKPLRIGVIGAGKFGAMYIAHRDFTPIRPLPDDCLLRHYDVPLPWKDGTPAEELQPALKAA